MPGNTNLYTGNLNLLLLLLLFLLCIALWHGVVLI